MNILAGISVFGNEEYAKASIESIISSAAKFLSSELYSPGDRIDLMVIYNGFVCNEDIGSLFSHILRYRDAQRKNNGILYGINIFMEDVSENMGFPHDINVIFNYAFNVYRYDHVGIFGSDVLVEKGFFAKTFVAIDRDDPDWLGTIEFKPKIDDPYKTFSYKEIMDIFYKNMVDLPREVTRTADLSKFRIIGDSFNANIFSRRLFDRIGYVDAMFYPGGYFSDNDFGRRAILSRDLYMYQYNIRYMHLWSRTIYNVKRNGVSMKSVNDFYFPINKEYYKNKWGGEPGKETITPNSLRIEDPEQIDAILYMQSLSRGRFEPLVPDVYYY